MVPDSSKICNGILTPSLSNCKRQYFAACRRFRALPFDHDRPGDRFYAPCRRHRCESQIQGVSMKSKALWWMASAVGVVVLAVGISALAQSPMPTHFSGLINDYTPQTINQKLVGPWVMNGTWTLDLKGRSGLADFSAAMNMELSDYAVVNGVVKNVDDPDPQVRIAH